MSAFVLLLALLAGAFPAWAYDGVVEKKVFSMPSYTTVGGRAIKNVRVGYETYGTLNEAKDNAILICHGFGGTSHAAGKYTEADSRPGYWDAIVGAGKPIDTDRFFVVSSDTLVNLTVKDPNTITTGPASINPVTGEPYGMTFPIVTIRDYVNVQKALFESLGITRLHAVAGPSQGAYQTFEWAAAYPDMVARIIPVIGAAEASAYGIQRVNIWTAAIQLDPRWNNGNYYGKDEPVAGLALAFKLLLHAAGHYETASRQFGRRWAAPGRDPLASWDNTFAAEAGLDQAVASWVRRTDANSFLYGARASQLFVAGHKGSLEEGLQDVKAKVLLIPARSDLLVYPEYSRQAMEILKRHGKQVEYFEIEGTGGHLEGIFGIAKAGAAIRRFLSE